MHWVSESWDLSIRNTYDIERIIHCDCKLTLDTGNNQESHTQIIEHSFTRKKRFAVFANYCWLNNDYFELGIRYSYLNPQKFSVVYTLNCRECLNLLNKFIPLTGKQDIKISLSVKVVVMVKIFSKTCTNIKDTERFLLDD